MSMAFGVFPQLSRGAPRMVIVPRERCYPPPKPPKGRKGVAEAVKAAPELVVKPAVDEKVREAWRAGFTAAEKKFTLAPLPSEISIGRIPTMLEIATEVAAKHKVTLLDLRSHRRFRPIALARQEAMHRMYQETQHTTVTIGKFFSRDHTTVTHACQAYRRRDTTV